MKYVTKGIYKCFAINFFLTKKLCLIMLKIVILSTFPLKNHVHIF